MGQIAIGKKYIDNITWPVWVFRYTTTITTPPGGIEQNVKGYIGAMERNAC